MILEEARIYNLRLTTGEEIVGQMDFWDDFEIQLKRPCLAEINRTGGQVKIALIELSKLNPMVERTITIPRTSILWWYKASDATTSAYTSGLAGILKSELIVN